MIDKPEDLIPLGIFAALIIRFFLLIHLLGSIQEKRTRAGLDILKTKIGLSNLPANLQQTFSSFFDEAPQEIKYSLYYRGSAFEIALARIVTGHGKSRGVRQYLFLQSDSSSLADFSWTQRLRESDVPAVGAVQRETANKILAESNTQLRSANRWLLLRGDIDTSMPADSRLSPLSRSGRYAGFFVVLIETGRLLLKIQGDSSLLEALMTLRDQSQSAPEKKTKARYLLLVPLALLALSALLIANVFAVKAIGILMSYSTKSKALEWSIGCISIFIIWFVGVAINREYEKTNS